VDVIIKEKFAY